MNNIKFIPQAMLNKTKHRVVLIEILKSIYADPDMRTVLGFKGGTAALLFYDLPRMSVDLDFNLIDLDKKKLVFDTLKVILGQFGMLREAVEKRYTLFFLLSYEKQQHTIKVEISKRTSLSGFQPMRYLGISMLVMKQGDMVANKLVALLTRREFVMRDVFDLWFFLKNKWEINEQIVKECTQLSLSKALKLAENKIDSIDKHELLKGLGELVDERQKIWIKNHLITDVLFYVKLYEDVVKREK